MSYKIKKFESFNQNAIDILINDIKKTANDNNVKIIIDKGKTIPYYNTNVPVSGYFIDYGTPTLAVATGKPVEDWVMILVHESCHMDQYIERSPYWTTSFIDGKEAVEHIQEWCDGAELSESKLDYAIKKAREVELDCEKRTMEKAKSYGLSINIEEEIQKANSYILFYTLLKETRKWNKPGKPPYKIKEVWSALPNTFNMDYTVVPDDIKELYIKYCF